MKFAILLFLSVYSLAYADDITLNCVGGELESVDSYYSHPKNVLFKDQVVVSRNKLLAIHFNGTEMSILKEENNCLKGDPLIMIAERYDGVRYLEGLTVASVKIKTPKIRNEKDLKAKQHLSFDSYNFSFSDAKTGVYLNCEKVFLNA
jgi:hypothetical protein